MFSTITKTIKSIKTNGFTKTSSSTMSSEEQKGFDKAFEGFDDIFKGLDKNMKAADSLLSKVMEVPVDESSIETDSLKVRIQGKNIVILGAPAQVLLNGQVVYTAPK